MERFSETVLRDSFAQGGPLILGISGGSGSGKTTLARSIEAHFGPQLCEVLYQDSYYLDQSHRFDQDGGQVNYDHPEALDFDLMSHHLEALAKGLSVQIPKYDFVTHSRRGDFKDFSPKPLVVVDGILILSQPQLRQHFNRSVFVDTPEELRFQRRLERDVRERGRTPDGVKRQFYSQVKPMHDLFVEPSKLHADLCVSGLSEPIHSLEKIFGLGFESHKNLVFK